MKTNLGKALSKQEMKSIIGGKLPGCAMVNQNGTAYTNGCCTGLSQCASTAKCMEPGTCPCVGC